MSTKLPTALAILGCCATWTAAQDLNMKPGLWEITTTQELKGDPTTMMSAEDKAQMEAAKARMSPEQRAQMETFMKQGAMPKPRIEKKCVTKEDIDKKIPNGFVENSKSNCKVTPIKSTATVIERREVCSKNGNNSNTTLLFELQNPETFTARIETSPASGGSAVYAAKASGKWLGPACGNVK